MKRLFSIIFLTLAVAMGIIPVANAEETTPPEGERLQYVAEMYFMTPYNMSWTYRKAMIENIVFEDGKLYIEKICGVSGWFVGEINEQEHYAVCKLPQQFGTRYELRAFYKDGNKEVDLDEVYFDLSEDNKEISLRPVDESTVTFKLLSNGNPTMWWSDLTLHRWTEKPATPPVSGSVSYMKMDYVDAYLQSQSTTVHVTTLSNEIWMSGFVESGCMKGEIQNNGTYVFKCLSIWESTETSYNTFTQRKMVSWLISLIWFVGKTVLLYWRKVLSFGKVQVVLNTVWFTVLS